MNDVEVTKFDDYWRTITRNEEFIRQHGHHGCPDWEDKWHQDLDEAYSHVRPLLASVTERRMFHGLPGDLNPFEAENYHHALVLVLNPPERWFGNMGMLRSPEYLALKQGAEGEEKSCQQDRNHKGKPLQRGDDMSPGERIVFGVIDETPRQGPEVANRISAKIDAADIRRYLSQLKKRGYISHLPGKGYYRL